MSSETSMVTAQYRLREWAAQQIVPVVREILQQEKKNSNVPRAGLDISIKGLSIHVEEASSIPLLAEILKVMPHADQEIIF